MGVANKTYYLDENRELTEDQSKAAFVLINEGQEIPKEMADQYGIGKDTGSASKVAQADATATTDGATAADEAAGAPKSTKSSANKAARPAKNK